MKTLTTVLESTMTPLYESLLDDFDEISQKVQPEEIKQQIRDYIAKWYGRAGFSIKISDGPNKKGLFEVSGFGIGGYNICLDREAPAITNGLFVWTKVNGDFDVYYNKNITSLEGAPSIVEGNFNCWDCLSLKSLEGGPNKCRTFNCNECPNLKSLKGAPKICDSFRCCKTGISDLMGSPKECGEFLCWSCSNLKSLKGAPKTCARFDCSYCKSLKSLKGAPSEVVYAEELHMYLDSNDGEFSCEGCGGEFIEDDVKQVCYVAGEILC